MAGVRLGGTATIPTQSLPITVISVSDGGYVALAGTNVQVSDFDPAGDDQSNPILSPDGTLIAFNFFNPGPNGEGQICTVPANGVGAAWTVISPNDVLGAYMRYPTWNNTSTQVAYVHEIPGGGIFKNKIVKVSLSAPGTETTLYTSANGYGAYRPQWSPDGTQIAFLVNDDAGTGSPAAEGLWIMDADGSNLTQLDSWGRTGYGFDGEQLGWAPDGSLIAYWASFDDNGSLYVIAPDGTGKTQIDIGDTSGTIKKRCSNRCWLADSSKVIASGKWNGSSALWRAWSYSTDGTTPETILDNAHGPNDTEYFRCVYRVGSKVWFIPTRTPFGKVANTDLDGTNYAVVTTLGTELDGDEFLNGAGLVFL